MIQVPQEAFTEGVLDKTYHARLLANVEGFASDAGIPPMFVWKSATTICSKRELEVAAYVRKSEKPGVLFIGEPVDVKFMALTGMFLRNYIQAKFVTLQELLSSLKAEEAPSPSVLLIPNFCVAKSAGGDVPQWQLPLLLGFLLTRASSTQKTFLHIDSVRSLEDYGLPIYSHIMDNYEVVV